MHVILMCLIDQLCALQGTSIELFLLSFHLDVYKGHKLKTVQ